MRPKSRADFAIAIICALPLEADAVEGLFDEHYDRLGQHYGKQPGDANAYLTGRIGQHDVVLSYMPGMGKGSAASVTSSLRVSYTGIQLALLVGICQGAPSPSKHQEIFLGDVIISDSVIEYDFGRRYPGGFRRKTGVLDALGRPDREIRTLLNGLRGSRPSAELQTQVLRHLRTLQQLEERWEHPGVDDVLFDASVIHRHHELGSGVRCCCLEGGSLNDVCEDALDMCCDELGCDRNQVIRCRNRLEADKVATHIGTVASADTVMKSGKHRDEIVKKEKMIAFETQGAGVWDNVSCIIIKGVCDYADSHKIESWQAYAAATAASAAKAFLEYWRPLQREDVSKERHLMIPFRRNPRFVGRQQEIAEAEERISIADGPRIVAVTGLGGVGKTQVALELAYRMRDQDPDCSIFWIPCTSYESIQRAYMAIAQLVGLQGVNPARIKEHLQAYFSSPDSGKWLLIFDNADDLDIWTKGDSKTPPLKNFLPRIDKGHTGSIIFTSRNRKLAVRLVSADVILVPELDHDTGLELLKRSLLRSESLLVDSQTATTLLKQLTFLPLAITQAAAYINENGIALADYLLLLQEEEADVVELLSEDFSDDGRYKDVQNPVALTWLISFHQIKRIDPLASDYLSLMACINPRNIPHSFLPRPASKKRIVEALGLLSAYSFITTQPGEGSITLHRLVHLATRNWMKKEQRFSLYVRRAASQLSEAFSQHDHANRPLLRQYLPHAIFLIREDEFRSQQQRYIDYMHNADTCLDGDARYHEAEDLLVQVMNIWKRVQGPEQPSTLISQGEILH
ncbi:Pfs, NB-ARC and TPR domain protein [Aspergillus homomorphus CBS 101889]|uniref:Purine and uridine phosphorylase n=1 Tax=Aspergillus homomorphus (strain CBS 101889) TaxID=1450537 RepID=A0A395HXG4_ASPHC|nr:purine and uridine phosphorylase [Aspergillus homomorphus CBS 101889]RAL11558.1 purine and uridine phosphorylase [Aspergillus homomorphus CBS 101889]